MLSCSEYKVQLEDGSTFRVKKASLHNRGGDGSAARTVEAKPGTVRVHVGELKASLPEESHRSGAEARQRQPIPAAV